MQPGDLLCFHKKTQHASPTNESDDILWSMDLRYNPVGQPCGRPWFPSFVGGDAALAAPGQVHDLRQLVDGEVGVSGAPRWIEDGDGHQPPVVFDGEVQVGAVVPQGGQQHGPIDHALTAGPHLANVSPSRDPVPRQHPVVASHAKLRITQLLLCCAG
jgi:hypothetical protein